MSYCRNRLSEPTSSMISSACAVAVRKKPGMSRVLIGSISSRMPRPCRRRRGDAQVLDERRARPRLRARPVGAMPARQLTLLAAQAPSRTRWPRRRRRGTRPRGPGWQAMPRSPARPVAGRQVVQHLVSPCSLRAVRQMLRCVVVVGEQVLDAREARGAPRPRSGRGNRPR